MYKSAAQHIKLARYAGTARALGQFGFPPQMVYSILMEKGASADEAEVLTKEAFGLVARGLGFLGSKVAPAIAKRLGGVAAKAGAGAAAKPGLGGRLAGWGSGMANRAGEALNTAAQGFKTDPWGTAGKGTLGLAHGATLAGGKGVGATVGKGLLGATTVSAIAGGGGQPMPQPQYGGY
jgi:hypothetical protein